MMTRRVGDGWLLFGPPEGGVAPLAPRGVQKRQYRDQFGFRWAERVNIRRTAYSQVGGGGDTKKIIKLS